VAFSGRLHGTITFTINIELRRRRNNAVSKNENGVILQAFEKSPQLLGITWS
jgi:hypothetical protein